MSVFAAMLLDSYRELNSRKLFWVILALSALFVILYGSIGFDETGMYLFFGLTHIDSEFVNADSPLSDVLYRGIFSTFVVPLWLAWIATILALISTATVFPDFVAGGSIDLVLSKPIGRIRLFLYKYIASLLFVLLQVAIFCIGIFVCMGVRLGDWEVKVFLAVPIVLIFFSYLFSVCVLIGVWTRSALAALLLTLLLWFGLYTINQAEGILNVFRTQMTVEVERDDARIIEVEQRRQELVDQNDETNVAAIQRVDDEIESLRASRDEQQGHIDTLVMWHQPVRWVQAVLPKTSETIGLLDRYLSRETDINLMDMMSGNVTRNADGEFVTERDLEDQAMARMAEEYASRSLFYVVGSSLLFEFIVLGLACWIFCRRDY